MNYLEPDELLKLLGAARKESLRDWLMLCMTLNHALRASETCKIRLEDIKDYMLTVERKKGSRKTTQPIRTHRGFPLLDEQKGLRMWLKERPKDSGSVLFPSQRGGAMTPRHFGRIYKYYAKKVGLPDSKAHVHCLKHSCLTNLAKQGMDAATLQQYSGHRELGSLMIYVHLNDADASKKAQDFFLNMF